ncbi:MAG: hypothetical protein C0483_20320 [Pirellula sp.]|nr:hypothetical protein [Pirellula sp.]
MFARFVMPVAVVLSLVAVDVASASSYNAYQRAAIRSMPITARPYRPGHVYGNTVRALNRIGR